ncbi:MAG: isocitrate/isopropylmalate family dehydrogenase, partial [Sulfurospirillaceae bacterium]|nr:isocitrate/isopropylmalate family dehydrogenase [Sulfurospirillaceae bacterium]
LSASMMLRFALNESKAADRIEKAVKHVLKDGYRTKDLSEFNAKEICSTSQIGSIIADCVANI